MSRPDTERVPETGKLNSDYTWTAYGWGGGEIEIDLGDSGGYGGCPHNAVQIDADQFAAMSAGLAQAIADHEKSSAASQQAMQSEAEASPSAGANYAECPVCKRPTEGFCYRDDCSKVAGGVSDD